MKRLLIQNGLLVDTEWTRHADILVEDSKIVRITASIEAEEVPLGTEIIHAEGLCVLPGIIDAHTHYHLVSRGTVTADSFEEGSRCAAYGGVTCVIDFADDDKKGNLAACTKERINAMHASMAVDFSLHQGLYSYREGLEEELTALKKAGVKVIKMFTTYRNVGYLVEKQEELKAIFTLCKKLDLLVSVHCEDDATIQKVDTEYSGPYDPPAHALLRPSEAEARGIDTVGKIALELDMSLYIVHLSSKAGLQKVRELRAKGLRVIVETTPHYLFLNKEKLQGPDGALYVMTPPLRSTEDNEALQEAVLNGEVQVIATDHCSFTVEQKKSSNDCRSILPGIPGTEELLSLVYSFAANSGRIGVQQVVNLLSTAPAKAFGLYPNKGAIRVGSDADLVLFDPDHAWTISKETIHSASMYSPYEGMQVIGKPLMTYLRGRLIMGDGMYLGITGNGEFVPQRDVGRGKTIMH
ncbi:dihydroorotase [Sphaerochaeta globosa]|uniref:Dihydropyrimidinase n=1 Tax=Sphaerochaeta globosa (strain ATCC BAA-1886 / DSM 22777 / Buddy) TaxID=158189 RepID=F0RTK4_SPHGB|nr:dihydroorotase [Sphaerochaeta globosa]ADY13912.1 Dihydropyrimidinase [Sphaerochaeta globosa str. Buddy]